MKTIGYVSVSALMAAIPLISTPVTSDIRQNDLVQRSLTEAVLSSFGITLEPMTIAQQECTACAYTQPPTMDKPNA